MNLAALQKRSNHVCELCAATGALQVYEVPPTASNIPDREIYICNKCLAQIEQKEEIDSNHWQCLSTAMWSEVPAVQVVAWRLLNRLRNESWAADNLDLMYLDDATLAWAKATGEHESDHTLSLHKDANGQLLANGDTIILTKSLDVKGSSVNARLGTVVKNIRLDANDTNYVEGKIEGQSIMIKTIYVRKQGV
ncbi:phosphonoacetate hydrolase [Chitinophaga costaii]|uniref:Phosphonoacetate hydrolase n=1 Tax=Chitinophaga costaii TaxID=1335309 RepID=A0A1C4EH26_9BACT|nr:alkylphosphonate utilization protein [Chitinophaga costaii]PUZ23828.1 PhnA protein [Chitinophaga costaii]SCC42887.1 phosphonoacetate hydrolase [Chitinophaga costaii]